MSERPGERLHHGRPARRPPRIAVRRFAGPEAYAGIGDRVDGSASRSIEARVVHLTDLHFGRVTPLAVQRRAVALANAERPDLVALTGDFVCHGKRYLDQLVEVLSALEAPAFAVLGNHDHWSGASEVARALARAGVELLSNRHTTLTLRGARRLQIVGLDDAYTGHARRDEAVKGLRRDLPAIGLSHIGEEADGLWRDGVPLVLSGHTHAGQVTVARLHELTLGKVAGHRYVHGLYGTRRAGPSAGALYVGAGIGAAVMPLRLGDRGQRELAVFELGTLPGALVEHHAEQPALAGRRRAAKPTSSPS